ncbi:hypothetical protein CLI64_30145 (plasmid) [Nostoc sp. CENA543]|uniref:DUF732 domain-containing protein n=1 Tax=Nostoc sp. CENA543 TaxID=1869241 RepID=UPI000CA19223|nr:DUF732 domain-containing protein [Nostoc sp. CENA543]AUT04702.1 hypothetical protein CLI64_30145 [Nostoc sp. CENA543]
MWFKFSQQKLIVIIVSWLFALTVMIWANPVFAAGDDDLFLQKFNDYIPEELIDLFGGVPFPAITDSEKIEAAQFACRALNRGNTLTDLNLLGMKINRSLVSEQKYIAALMQAAVETYCPTDKYLYQAAVIRRYTDNL